MWWAVPHAVSSSPPLRPPTYVQMPYAALKHTEAKWDCMCILQMCVCWCREGTISPLTHPRCAPINRYTVELQSSGLNGTASRPDMQKFRINGFFFENRLQWKFEFHLLLLTVEARGGAFGSGTALQAGRSRVRFPMVSLDFFIDINLPAAIWPSGRLNLQQKWVPGMFPGGKGGRCVGLTTSPSSCAESLEIWESQPPGTRRACPGL
jgi:hypothetical protein